MPMTPAQMLAEMGIPQADFDDYLIKLGAFIAGLSPIQQAFHIKNHGRTAREIARSLGPDATAADVQGLFAAAPSQAGVIVMSCCR